MVQVFFVRNGKLIGREHFYLTTVPGDTGRDILTSFIKQYYIGTPFIPHELLVQEEVEEAWNYYQNCLAEIRIILLK